MFEHRIFLQSTRKLRAFLRGDSREVLKFTQKSQFEPRNLQFLLLKIVGSRRRKIILPFGVFGS